jgi:hypothetical protein
MNENGELVQTPQTINLVDLETPEPPYLILESLPHLKENNSSRSIYILKGDMGTDS